MACMVISISLPIFGKWWRVWCGVWCVVFGVWYVVCGMRCVVCGVWCKKCLKNIFLGISVDFEHFWKMIGIGSQRGNKNMRQFGVAHEI